MAGKILNAFLFIALGAIAATFASWLRVPEDEPPAACVVAPAPRAAGAGTARSAAGTDTAPRVRELEDRLARESSDRQRLQNQLDDANARLAALHQGGGASAPPIGAQAAAPPPVAAHPDPAAAASAEAAAPPEVDYSKSEMERALIAGGLDPNTAADVKRRSDELSMAKMYLRDQAAREEWVDTPRFQEEMATLDAQQVSFRNELGDDGYDRFLFSLGQSNRVRVDDVMSGSPAADAGFEVGDMILRYGNTRVFAPDELVAQTQTGDPGETVSVTVIRQGKLVTVEVPRGPLGLRIAATQSNPQSG